MPKKPTPRLGRLRKSVAKLNMMYGLFVTEFENWRGRITDIEQKLEPSTRDIERDLDREAEALAGAV